MEFRQIRYFLAVAEDLHFTRAADRLHVAQPALSQQIRQLEDELGVKLLRRTNRRVELTPAGEAFRARTLLAMDQITRAGTEASQVGRGETGTLSLGFVSSAVWGALPILLQRFRRQAPLAEVDLHELEPAEQLRALRERHLDCGMMHAAISEPDLSFVVVARDRLIVALPEAHPAAADDSANLADLARETIFIPKRHASAGFHELVLEACRKAGFRPARIQTTRLLQTAVALVAGGIGIALVPESFRNNLQIRGVVYRTLSGTPPIAELVAVWRTDNDSPLLLHFREELRKYLLST